MADELIDIVDENNNLTGVQKMKSEAHRDGLWHRTAHVWLYNSQGQILLQLRSKDKDNYPDKWDISAAGHISAGEDIENGTLREVEEEIGLKLAKDDLSLLFIRKKAGLERPGFLNNEFCYVYLLKFDGNAENLKFQDGEVQKVQFFTTDDLEGELKNNSGSYVPHGDYWDKIITAVKERINS